MTEYSIQCEHGAELKISRWENGKYSITVSSSTGQQSAHLVVPTQEARKLDDALREMSTKINSNNLQ